MEFQSTLSMRRATRPTYLGDYNDDIFQSTLSMRRATGMIKVFGSFGCISIHALHEESDLPHMPKKRFSKISIHALHEESDLCHPWRIHALGISIHALHEESDFFR